MNNKKNIVRQKMNPFFFINFVKNEKTKLSDPHAHKARIFRRNTADISFPPARDITAVQRTSQANENANAFLKNTNNFFIPSMLSLQTDELFQRCCIAAGDHYYLAVFESCKNISGHLRLETFYLIEINDDRF